MVLLFELIKKNFTSFGPVSVFSICPPEEELENVAFGKNLIKSAHNGTLEDKIPQA